MIDQYAVVGNPIAHSKSPLIHEQFAKQTKQEMDYRAILGEIGQLEKVIGDFKKQNGKGLNITVPFKQDAWELVNKRNPYAEKAGAVNTIIVEEDGLLVGDNTDGVGLISDLIENLDVNLNSANILVLGAGGAVRGVLGPMLNKNPNQVVIANRTKSKADVLVRLFESDGNIVSSSFDNLKDIQFDLVINGTAASLSGDVPPVPNSSIRESVCYDMMYSKQDTVFMQWAKENGASQVWDGLGMLVEQAAESFLLWRGVRPNTQPVIQYIRETF